MKIYLVKWSTGENSVAICKNTEELFWLLDEDSNPMDVVFKEIKPKLLFNVTKTMCNLGLTKYELSQIGEDWMYLDDKDFEKDFKYKFGDVNYKSGQAPWWENTGVVKLIQS